MYNTQDIEADTPHLFFLINFFSYTLASLGLMSGGRGAFVDPKGVRWDTNDADFEGWLSKKSMWLKGLSSPFEQSMYLWDSC